MDGVVQNGFRELYVSPMHIRERHVFFVRSRFENAANGWGAFGGEHMGSALDDPRFRLGDFAFSRSKKLDVIQPDIGDHGRSGRGNSIRRIELASASNLDDGPCNILSSEVFECRGKLDFEVR